MTIKTISKTLTAACAAIAMTVALTGCNDDKSYAELLTDETHYVNNYLADQRVTNTIPTDTNFVFEYGEDAPYYRLDEDGQMYMQVINPGTKGNYATDDEVIYFRFTRYNLANYKDHTLPAGEGNETNMEYMNSWFRFQNFSLESTYQWGTGVQTPLTLLPLDCEVNLVVKSQYGFYQEMSYVIPFLFRLRYFRQQT